MKPVVGVPSVGVNSSQLARVTVTTVVTCQRGNGFGHGLGGRSGIDDRGEAGHQQEQDDDPADNG